VAGRVKGTRSKEKKVDDGENTEKSAPAGVGDPEVTMNSSRTVAQSKGVWRRCCLCQGSFHRFRKSGEPRGRGR
jgi:hypothetical protein